MRLLLLSLLAAGSVQSHAIDSTGATGYAYRSGLLAYSPERSEFPVDSTLPKGFLHYIADSGIQRANGYMYPEPLKAMGRQFNIPKEHNTFFRNWCDERLKELKAEIAKLHSAGIVPPKEMVEQLEPLQEVLSGSNAATLLSETAEVQRAIHAQQLHPLVQIPSIQLRSATLDAKETVQLKNERLVHDEKEPNAAEPVTSTEPQLIFHASQVRLSPSGFVLDTPQVMQAREEHFRLYNEAKLRAEKAGYGSVVKQEEAGNKPATENAVLQKEQQLATVPETILSAQVSPNFLQEHSLDVPFQQLAVGLRSVAGFDVPTDQQLRAIEDTPEVKRAREEHLKLKKQQEAVIAMQLNTEQVQKNTEAETVEIPLSTISQTLSPANQLSIGLRTGADSEQAVTVLNQPGQIEVTAEVKRAREEHLRLVEEAKLNAANSKKNDDKIQQEKIEFDDEVQKEEIDSNDKRYCEVERKIYVQRLQAINRLLEAELLRVRQEEKQIKNNERIEAQHFDRSTLL